MSLKLIRLYLIAGLRTLKLTSAITIEHESDTEAWVNLDNLGVSIFTDVQAGYYRIYLSGSPLVDLVPGNVFNNVQEAIAELFAEVTRHTIYREIEAVRSKQEASCCEQPARVTCGTCELSWCERCDPCPSALCHRCHGRGHSTAPLEADMDQGPK